MSERTFDDQISESVTSMVRRHDTMIERHDKVLFHGNGKPGICTRVQQNEDKIEAGEERMDHAEIAIDKRFADTNKRQDRTQSMFWAIILLLITLLGGVIGDIVSHRSEPAPQNRSLLY